MMTDDNDCCFLRLVLFQICCRRRCYPNNIYYDYSRISPPENRGRDGRARLVGKRGTGSRKYVRARDDDIQSRGARALAIHPRRRGSPATRNPGILVWILWLDTLRCCCSVDWIDVVKGAGAVRGRCGGGGGEWKAEGEGVEHRHCTRDQEVFAGSNSGYGSNLSFSKVSK